MSENLLTLCPAPPDWRLPWHHMISSFNWLNTLADCPQDPIHHAEGDVLTHTRMVCEALIALPAWRNLPDDQRQILFAAAVLHDIGKPDRTRIEEDGSITSRGHSRRGEVLARGLLWRMEISFAAREQICALIRFHQAPYFLIERNDPVRLAVEISQTVNCSHLAVLAEADVRGRLCADQQRLLDNVAMFAIHCQELGLLNRPHAFESDHQRVLYFLDKRRHLNTPAYPSFRTQVVMMAGLPGTGKDDYIRKTLPDWPVVSLDDLRDEMGVSPDDNQGRIIQKARESARDFLRKSQPFVWNATNVSRQLRGLVLDMLLSYQAHVRICYVEASRKILTEQIRQRDRKIPERIMNRLIDRWEIPDITEAHEVTNHVRQ